MHTSHPKNNICVERALREIDQIQNNSHYNDCRKEKKKKENRCRTGCCQAIDELLNSKTPILRKNTIPFILYLKDGCPFQADGVVTYHCKCCDKERFKAFRTFLFRLCHFKYDCAVLELLTFKDEHHDDDGCGYANPCCQIDGQMVENLIRTGVYIKVDPSCFCVISILPPVNVSSRTYHQHAVHC